MTSTDSRPFRFLDLPVKIRNAVYRMLLCNFEHAPTRVAVQGTSDFEKLRTAKHSIEPAVLCTNQQIHREAYDVMVRENGFVHVKCVGGLPLGIGLMASCVPIVTQNAAAADRFRGYILSVSLCANRDSPRALSVSDHPLFAPCSLIILSRDLDGFCRAVADADIHIPGCSKLLVMSITVAPKLAQLLPMSQKSIGAFLTEKMQETVLSPFRRLRGLKAVQVHGHVSRELANAVRDQMG
ncbi:Uu.00g095860.m01.CDS01 [Anthostomella pinea]|uniref:Uu.00g095860.m01.CDS01 n=1 Tax=Anthostomella pinea TaxID=933095 RepID=A0AAI8VCM9_9PEZI|nr:Uu.00g095860.m01.CDS01 [Anthostomella pinea]